MKATKFNLPGLCERGVTVREAEQALHDGWPRRRPGADGLVQVLGRTREGRLLVLDGEETASHVWVHAARDAEPAGGDELGGEASFTALPDRGRVVPFRPGDAVVGRIGRALDEPLGAARVPAAEVVVPLDGPAAAWLIEVAEAWSLDPGQLAARWLLERLARGPVPADGPWV